METLHLSFSGINFALEIYNKSINIIMNRVFVIGEREKNEWVSVFDKTEKQMAFCNAIDQAKTFANPEQALQQLQEMQLTGYFMDLGVYLVQDGRAYIAGESDNYHPID